MSANSALRALLERIEARRKSAERLLYAEIGWWELFRLSIARQGTYLAWIAALTLIHLLEVWVLIRFHYAFPPPAGLTALRVVSSFSTLGLSAALAIRWADFDTADDQGELSSTALRLRRLCECARMLFFAASLCAVALALWVVLFSRLDLSSAPVFRAVIFSGVLGLPVDVTAAFLLYMSTRVGAIPVSRKLRWLSIGVALCSLLPLALDYPAIYLLLALAPRIFLLKSAWRNLSGGTLRSLATLPQAYARGEHDFFARFRRNLRCGAFNQLCFDLSFLLLFGALSRFDAGIGLLLYLAHRTGHFAQVLLGKAHLTFSTSIKSALALGERKRLLVIMRALVLIACCYTLLSFIYAPLFLAQRQTLKWLSPLGEVVTVSPALIGIGLLLSASLVGLVFAGSVSLYLRSQRVLLLGAAFFLCGIVSRFVTPQVVHFLNFKETLLLLCVLQCATALGAFALVWRALIRLTPSWRTDFGRTVPLSELLLALGRKPHCGGTGLFAATLSSRKTWRMKRLSASLEPMLQAQDRSCIWGSTLFLLVLRENRETLLNFRLELVQHLAGSLERLTFSEPQAKSVSEVLREVLGKDDIAAVLYYLACGRRHTQDCGEEPTLVQELLRGSASHKTRCAVEGMEILQREPDWDLSGIADQDQRRLGRNFLNTLVQNGDALFPHSSVLKQFGGFVVLNKGASPHILLHVLDRHRQRYPALRYQAFRSNFEQLLNHVQGAM